MLATAGAHCYLYLPTNTTYVPCRSVLTTVCRRCKHAFSKRHLPHPPAAPIASLVTLATLCRSLPFATGTALQTLKGY
eukprot:2144785-Pyramimonas_sp.AAC.2